MDSKDQKYRPLDDSSSSPKLLLYSYWQSSCSWRVRFALNLKGLPYQYRAVNLAKGEQFSPEFEKLNPLHYVPVLIDDDVVVSDSYAVMLYLEEKYPNIPLLPVDPQLRAINLQTASIVSSSIQPLHMLSLLKYVEEKTGPEEALAWVQLNIENGFLGKSRLTFFLSTLQSSNLVKRKWLVSVFIYPALEKLLRNYAGKYATGNRIYMADVFLAPQIAVATMRFKIDMSKFPVLNMIYEACSRLPEFQASLPDRQPDAVPSSIS